MQKRIALLREEKELTKERDRVSKLRRELPWVKIEKSYTFHRCSGPPVTLSDLFGDKSQLIVVHFMFAEDWDEGCKSCSYLADMYDRCPPHLGERDVAFVACSTASPEKLERYKRKLGWSFDWVSSGKTDFNHDFNVTFSQDEVKEDGLKNYNFGTAHCPATEAPGMSVFYKDDQGQIYHTYSTFARGLDIFLTAYHFLDCVPKGRDEGSLDYTMAWIKRRTEYSDYVTDNWWSYLMPYGDTL